MNALLALDAYRHSVCPYLLPEGATAILPEELPIFLLPLLRCARHDRSARFCFIERSSVSVRDALGALCRTLDVDSLSTCTLAITRPSSRRPGSGAIAPSQSLPRRDYEKRIAGPVLGRIVRACKDEGIRQRLQCRPEWRLGDILDQIAQERMSPAWHRYLLFRQLCRLLLTAVRKTSTPRTLKKTLATVMADPNLRTRYARLRAQSAAHIFTEAELAKRLADDPIDKHMLVTAFADTFRDAINQARFLETDALKETLVGTALEAALKSNLIFVDDSLSTGETYVLLAMFYALYHGDSLPRFFTVCTQRADLVRKTAAPIQVSTVSHAMLEDLPQFFDSIWEFGPNGYIRTSYHHFQRQEGDTAAPEAPMHVGDFRDILSLKEVSSVFLPVLSEECQTKCIECVLTDKAGHRQTGFWTSFEADVFFNVFAREPVFSGWHIEAISESFVETYDRLAAALSEPIPKSIHALVDSIVLRSLQEWHDAHDGYLNHVNKTTERILLRNPLFRSAVMNFLETRTQLTLTIHEEDRKFWELVADYQRFLNRDLEARTKETGTPPEPSWLAGQAIPK